MDAGRGLLPVDERISDPGSDLGSDAVGAGGPAITTVAGDGRYCDGTIRGYGDSIW